MFTYQNIDLIYARLSEIYRNVTLLGSEAFIYHFSGFVKWFRTVILLQTSS